MTGVYGLNWWLRSLFLSTKYKRMKSMNRLRGGRKPHRQGYPVIERKEVERRWNQGMFMFYQGTLWREREFVA